MPAPFPHPLTGNYTLHLYLEVIQKNLGVGHHAIQREILHLNDFGYPIHKDSALADGRYAHTAGSCSDVAGARRRRTRDVQSVLWGQDAELG